MSTKKSQPKNRLFISLSSLMGSSESTPKEPKQRQPTKTTLSDAEYRKIVPRSFLFVLGFPRIQGETCIGDQRSFSIRGSDDVMYHTYLGNFIKTWGDYIVIVHPPARLRNGEWSFIAWTTPQVWDTWHQTKNVSS